MDTYYCQCTNCRQMVTITSVAAFHTATGCVSCERVKDEKGFYSEPHDWFTRKRANA
jgi:hypothetical protein